jgi:hypothetical protein
LTNALYRLVYLSHNNIAGDLVVVEEQIRDILNASRHNNMQAGVTGALMFNTEYFAQVLEGPHQAVQATFERIQCDERHSNAIVLLFEPSETRAFSNWAMAYVGQNHVSLKQFAAVGDESGFDFSALDGNEIFDLLMENLHEAEEKPR